MYGFYLGMKDGLVRLLAEMAKVEGLEWIRLLYCYPTFLSSEMIEFIASEPKVCSYIDVPLQHTHDEMLKSMKRQETEGGVRRMLDEIRLKIPDVALRTTFITGFPGETDEDFLETLNVINEGQFDSVYMFKFSPRPGTKANSMQDEYVSKSKIDSRFMELKKIQTDISHSRLQRFIGTHQHVLIEKYSKKTNDFLTGKIDGGQTTHIKAENVSIGDFVEVEIVDATPFALTAVLL